jgi:putative transposase
MTEADIEIILERAKEQYPGVRPRVISDNGPQFIAKDFKEFIRISGMTHVRTSPYYPQSNGKIERWHKSLKGECIRPGTPLSLEDARRLVKGYVEHYNNVRLNSAIGYVTPKDMLAGHQQEIQAERDRKLETAREQRGNHATGPRDADNLLFADDSGAVPHEPFIGDFRLYFRGPKTSCNITLRSSSAWAQSPVKLEPCMMASVLGFRSASFFKFCAVSGVYGTYSARTPA